MDTSKLFFTALLFFTGFSEISDFALTFRVFNFGSTFEFTDSIFHLNHLLRPIFSLGLSYRATFVNVI